MASNPHYRSYLLRLWRDNADHPWRASLQCTVSQEKYTFADLMMLFAFLVELSMTEGEAGILARFADWLQTQHGSAGSHTDDVD